MSLLDGRTIGAEKRMIGTKLGDRYEILGELGRGGMGVVYRARDPLLDREVAIKVVPPALLTPDAELRFQREAQLVAKMDHPAIVTVYDIGRHEGSLFFVMPVVGGTNLRALLRERSLRLGDVVDICLQVADALDYSHGQGVVHRDIKPENIMVWRGADGDGLRVRIMDFGLARASLESQLTRITHSGTLIGTVSYFSPEQVSVSREIDARSDVFSLGVVLYECLLGEPPFAGEVQSVLYRIVHEIPQSPTARGADVDPELEQIAMRSIARDPALRPQSAREVADLLARYRAGLGDEDRRRPIATASTRIHRPESYHREVVPFTGRERELAELQHRLNQAVGGECQFVVVGGEAGIGKSRLLEEIERLARARRIRVLHGRFVEQDRAFPYQGFCEVIQEYFRARESSASSSDIADFSDLASELGDLFPLLAEIGDIRSASHDSKGGLAPRRRLEDRSAIFELLARSVARIGAGRPLVLLFEDLHDADVSLEAIQYVVRRLGPTPTLVVGTYRTSEVDRRHAVARMLDGFHDDRRFAHVVIGQMPASEHRTFVEALVGGARVGDGFARALYDATEGNPFFTRELMRSLSDSGGIVEDDAGTLALAGEMGLSTDALPDTIQQVVEKQIERLPESDREALATAAVLGRAFEYRDLEALVGDRLDLEEIVDRLLRQGLLDEERESRGDRLAFASGVVRDALYAGLSRRRRRTLHRRYAEWLERRHAGKERFWAALAHHNSQGDVADKAVEYGLGAARRSLAAFSPEEAIRAAKTALEFLVDEEWPGERRLEGEARLLLAAAYRLEGNVEGALRESERAVRVFERERDVASALTAFLSAAESAWDGRKIEETRKWVERGIDAARDANQPESLSRILSLGATVANLRGEYEAAREYLEEIERLRPVADDPEPEVPRGGTLVVGLNGPCEQIEPALVRTVEEEEVSSLVFERLFATDERGNLVPVLCERWETLDGGRSLLVTLRAGVRFSDGTPLTAEDVKRSFERGVRLDRAAPRAAFSTIRGVGEVGATDGEVDGIVVRSEREIELRLKEALPIYPAILSDTGTGVVKVVRDDAGREVLLGTGPFRVASIDRNTVALARNDQYWGRTPAALDRVEFLTNMSVHEIAEVLRMGGIDVAREVQPEDLERLLRDPKVRPQLAEAPLRSTCFLAFNTSSPAVADPEVRRALGGVVRAQDLVWQSLGRLAQTATGIVPPNMLGHDPGRRRPSLGPAAAARALATARGDSDEPLRLRVAISPGVRDRHGALVENLFAVWRSAGAEASAVTPTMEEYLEAFHTGRDVDVIVCRWNADYDDPDNFTHRLFSSESGLLRAYFHSPETDQIADEARAEHRPSVREALYRRFENVLLDAGVAVPLFHEVNYRLFGRDVRGLRVLPTPPYVNYAELGKAESSGGGARPRPRPAGGGVVYAPGGTSSVESLDPAQISSLAMGEAVPNVFETLTRVVEGARVVPWLAAEFRAEDDARRFRFRLRDDVRFHDGRRLTARDVRYSFERFLQTADGSNRSLLAPIRGARAVIAGEAGDLEGFRILSTLEFAIELETPLRLLPVMLTNPATAILPEGGGDFDGVSRGAYAGTGPFRVVSFEPGARLELDRNPDYWRDGFPRCEGLVFTFGLTSDRVLAEFRAGRLSLATDLAPADVDALRHDSGYAPGYREIPRLATAAIALNCARGPLADPDVRRRVAGAIPAASIVKRVLARLAMPAHGLFPPGLLGYEQPRHPSGSPAPPARPPDETIELTLATTAAYLGRYAELTNQIVEAWRRAGVRVRVVEGSTAELLALQRAGEVDMALNTWIADYPDADAFAALLHTETGTLGGMCGSPAVDRLIERARTETEAATRHYLYRQIEDVVTRGATLVPLFHPRNYRFARADVEGLALTSYTYPSVAYENLRIT